jgi:hypothetical protein
MEIHVAGGSAPRTPRRKVVTQPIRASGPWVTERGPWARDLGQQEALRTYRDIPLFPALGIGIGAIMRDGGWKSEAMVARYTEHLQVKQGASAILAAKQARL